MQLRSLALLLLAVLCCGLPSTLASDYAIAKAYKSKVGAVDVLVVAVNRCVKYAALAFLPDVNFKAETTRCMVKFIDFYDKVHKAPDAKLRAAVTQKALIEYTRIYWGLLTSVMKNAGQQKLKIQGSIAKIQHTLESFLRTQSRNSSSAAQVAALKRQLRQASKRLKEVVLLLNIAAKDLKRVQENAKLLLAKPNMKQIKRLARHAPTVGTRKHSLSINHVLQLLKEARDDLLEARKRYHHIKYLFQMAKRKRNEEALEALEPSYREAVRDYHHQLIDFRGKQHLVLATYKLTARHAQKQIKRLHSRIMHIRKQLGNGAAKGSQQWKKLRRKLIASIKQLKEEMEIYAAASAWLRKRLRQALQTATHQEAVLKLQIVRARKTPNQALRRQKLRHLRRQLRWVKRFRARIVAENTRARNRLKKDMERLARTCRARIFRLEALRVHSSGKAKAEAILALKKNRRLLITAKQTLAHIHREEELAARRRFLHLKLDAAKLRHSIRYLRQKLSMVKSKLNVASLSIAEKNWLLTEIERHNTLIMKKKHSLFGLRCRIKQYKQALLLNAKIAHQRTQLHISDLKNQIQRLKRQVHSATPEQKLELKLKLMKLEDAKRNHECIAAKQVAVQGAVIKAAHRRFRHFKQKLQQQIEKHQKKLAASKSTSDRAETKRTLRKLKDKMKRVSVKTHQSHSNSKRLVKHARSHLKHIANSTGQPLRVACRMCKKHSIQVSKPAVTHSSKSLEKPGKSAKKPTPAKPSSKTKTKEAKQGTQPSTSSSMLYNGVQN